MEPNGGFRALHQANKNQEDKGFKLKRNSEAEDRLWRQASDELVHKPKLNVAVVSPWNMKSEEKDIFEKRNRDLERH